ncbi:MAG: metallophosphoesterase [Myxococcales bacterium]|nr:metallophosphoesterase [Myxococcales bacterium]
MLLVLTFALLGIIYAWATASFPVLGRHRRLVAGVLLALWVSHIISFTLFRVEVLATLPRALVDLAMLPLIFAAFPIALVRLVSWSFGRFGAAAKERPVTVGTLGGPVVGAPNGISRRQLVEAATGTAILGGTGAMLGWGMVRGRHAFVLREIPVRIPGLPRALDGYVIAQVSDIHAGPYVGDRELDEGLALVRKAKPDLVVATGDLVDFDAAFAPKLARKLADLAPPDGVAAILGNHDYYADSEEVSAALEDAGVDLLVDEGRVLRPGDGGGFALLGVDDRWSTRYGRSGPRLERALAMVPRELPRVLLSHQPVTVDRWPGQVALQLSGHTHGGQINPGFRPADLFLKYVAGSYAVGGTTLYVNSGFGTVGTPSRVGAPPEVTRVVLVAA